MKKNFILRLLLFAALAFSVHSCIRDDVYSATDPAPAEYVSKSFWKEDEKHIKNIIKIYAEHESKIKRVNGTPQWDYAMSMGKYDETFLVVPIVENNKVVSTLSCARFDKKVYFKYDNTPGNIVFFDKMLFGKYTRHKVETNKNNASSAQKGSICVTNSYSVWFPDNENDYWGSGHWESYSYQNCYSYQDYSNPDFNEGGSSGGFDYGGGGSGSNTDPNNPQNQTPCEKTKNTLQDPTVQAKIQELKNQSTQGGEKAFMVKPDGSTSSIIPGNEHSTHLGNTSGYVGYYHNHTPKGINMLSIPDIYKLFEFIIAQPSSVSVDSVFGGMIDTEPCPGCPDGYEYYNYVIRFIGTAQEAGNIYTSNYDFDGLRKEYAKFEQTIRPKAAYAASNGNFMSFKGLEEVFFNALDMMEIDKNKMILQRIDKNGNVTNVMLGTDGKPQDVPCPN